MNYIAVFIGAGMGGMARHTINMIGVRITAAYGQPLATLAINISGSFFMGIAAYYFYNNIEIAPTTRLFWTTGIIGGFTTFSAFSLDIVRFFETGRIATGATYAIASVVLSVTALLLGMAVARAGIN